MRRDIDIERLLVWTVRDQQAVGADAWGERAWLEGHGCSSDGMVAIARAEALGTHIDAGGRRVAGRVHADALTVIEMVERARWPTRALLLAHARTDSRPEWMPGAEPFRQVRAMVWRGAKLVPKVVRDKHGHARGFEMVTVDRRPEIAAARAAYARWHEGVECVARVLMANRGLLAAHRVTGFRAPARPWENGLERKAA